MLLYIHSSLAALYTSMCDNEAQGARHCYTDKDVIFRSTRQAVMDTVPQHVIQHTFLIAS